jgi:pyridoxine kinase
MARTANAVHAVLEATLAANRRELDLVGAQAALADPPARLAAEAA